jgi:hypothetical protein
MTERFFQRRLSPVSRISTASAKLDLPEPLRPTTSVSPGTGHERQHSAPADTLKALDRDRTEIRADRFDRLLGRGGGAGAIDRSTLQRLPERVRAVRGCQDQQPGLLA